VVFEKLVTKFIMLNKTIIDQFNLLIKQVQLDIDYSSGKTQVVHTYRLKSINDALKAIQKFPKTIKSSDDLKGIKGIGKGTLDRVDEILEFGKLAEIKVTKIDQTYLNLVNQLEKVFGIGRKKAYDLFVHHDIKTIADLKKKVKSGDIELPDNITKGLKYVDKIKENIPREEIDKLGTILTKTLKNIDPELFGIICGSYRRLASKSGDVDYIIVHPKLKNKDSANKSKYNYLEQVIQSLKEQKIIVDSLTSESVPTKYMGLFRLTPKSNLRRIDIRFIPYESYYSAILYFTGSRDFNKKMRRVAMDMGYVLNEYGLFDENGKMFKVKSENDIFDLLGMEWLAPEKRLG
jgi:DNA polymerase beta